MCFRVKQLLLRFQLCCVQVQRRGLIVPRFEFTEFAYACNECFFLFRDIIDNCVIAEHTRYYELLNNRLLFPFQLARTGGR